jgi:NAD(P)-dependent dehydrogenase (short-subunit alcohol dehydrogenase family)
MKAVSPKFSFDVSGKIVVVTGAGKGLGSGIAVRFAEAGADVVLHYFTSSSSAKGVLEKVEALGRRGVLVQGDLTRPDDVDRLFVETVAKYGRVDVLINNSGIYPETPLLEMTPSDWHKVIDANLTTAFLCTQAAARRMIAQGTKGAIVNIASIESENSDINHTHYCAAKAGLVMFTRVAARELGQYGIRVNAVSPGLIWREGIEESYSDGLKRWLKVVPLATIGQAVDVADACIFMASPAARWITGTNIFVDGGIMTCGVF